MTRLSKGYGQPQGPLERDRALSRHFTNSIALPEREEGQPDFLQCDFDHTIIGGGPGGVATAIGLARMGRRVAVLERQHTPQQSTDRSSASYNLTLTPTSVHNLDQLGAPIQDHGQIITMRCIHNNEDNWYMMNYGTRTSDWLLSVPRHVLMQKLLNAAKAAGVVYVPGVELLDVDTDGQVVLRRGNDLLRHPVNSVIAADGVYSRVRHLVARKADTSASRTTDGTQYAALTIPPEIVNNENLSLAAIHFGVGDGGVTIGVPDVDGSIRLLLIWKQDPKIGKTINGYEDMQRVLGKFTNRSLLDLVPNVTDLMGTTVRTFHYAKCGCWAIKGIALLGDAAHAMPPYLGQGVNAAIGDAASLIVAMRNFDGDFDAATEAYATDRSKHVELLHELADAHQRALFNGNFGGFAWRIRHRLGRLCEQVIGYRSAYQRLVFDYPMEWIDRNIGDGLF